MHLCVGVVGVCGLLAGLAGCDPVLGGGLFVPGVAGESVPTAVSPTLNPKTAFPPLPSATTRLSKHIKIIILHVFSVK